MVKPSHSTASEPGEAEQEFACHGRRRMIASVQVFSSSSFHALFGRRGEKLVAATAAGETNLSMRAIKRLVRGAFTALCAGL